MLKQDVTAESPVARRIKAVMAAKVVKARTWAIKANLDPDLVRNILRGKSLSPRTEHLVALSEAIGIDPDYLLMRSNSMETVPALIPAKPAETTDLNIRAMPMDLPIRGNAACGKDGLFELNGDVLDHVRRPPRLMNVKDAYGLWIQGESMAPWREHGGLVVVHPHQPIRINDYVVVQLKAKDGAPIPAYIKRLVRRSATSVQLLQYNPNKEITIPTKEIRAIHRILDWDEAMGI